MHHPTNRIIHTTPFVTPVVEHWLEREIAQSVHHEGLIRRPIAPLANALTTELHLAPYLDQNEQDNRTIQCTKSKVCFCLTMPLEHIDFLSLSSVIGRHSYGHVDTLFRRKPAATT